MDTFTALRFQVTVLQVFAAPVAVPRTSTKSLALTSTLSVTTAPARLELTRAVISRLLFVKPSGAVSKKMPPKVSGFTALTIFRAMPLPPAGPASTVGSAPAKAPRLL